MEALYVNTGRYMLTVGGHYNIYGRHFTFHLRYMLTVGGNYNLFGRYFTFHLRYMLTVEALFLF